MDNGRLDRALYNCVLGLAAVLVCGALTGTASAAEVMTGAWSHRGLTNMDGTYKGTGTLTVQKASGNRYLATTAQVGKSVLRSGAMDAARRGIKHPAFQIAVAGLGYLFDEDGNIVEEDTYTVLVQEDMPQPPDGYWRAGWIVKHGEWINSLCEGPDGAPSEAYAYLEERNGLIPGRYELQKTVTCNGDQPRYGYRRSDYEDTNSYIWLYIDLWPATETDPDAEQLEEIEVTDYIQIPDTSLDSLITDNQWTNIGTDLVTTPDAGHGWRSGMDSSISDNNKPMPPSVQNQLTNFITAVETGGEEGTGADDQQVTELQTLIDLVQEQLDNDGEDDPPEEPPDESELPPEPDAEFQEVLIKPDDFATRDIGPAEATCPDPVEYNLTVVDGYSVQGEISYEHLCVMAGYSRPIIIAVAWLWGAFIVVRV